MSLNIRDAEPTDLPALAALLAPEADDDGLRLLEGQLAIEMNREVTRMVAELDGQIVGLVTVRKLSPTLTKYLLHHREHPLGNFELGRLYVHPDCRRRGIGRALLGEVNYLGRIVVALRPHQTIAQFFLRSAGRAVHGRFNTAEGPFLVMAQRHDARSRPLRVTTKIAAAQ